MKKSDVDTQNFNFLSLKRLSPGQFLGSYNLYKYHGIFRLLIHCDLKIRGLGAKLCVTLLPAIAVLKGSMMLGPSTNNFPSHLTDSK